MDDKLVRLITHGTEDMPDSPDLEYTPASPDPDNSNDSEESYGAAGEELVRFLTHSSKDMPCEYHLANTDQPHRNTRLQPHLPNQYVEYLTPHQGVQQKRGVMHATRNSPIAHVNALGRRQSHTTPARYVIGKTASV